jgi:Cft2 family RNA processing exonuclease
MQLTFLGGADEVGASSTLIQIAGKTILVDAGIRISPRSNRGIQNDQLPDLHPISASGGPDYILVTHAHTDHTGALPLVVEQYPHVPVLATRPTIELVRILQADAQRIMQSRQEQEGELPLFDEIAAERLMSAFQVVEFRQPVRLGGNLQVTYHPAGHIAGAGLLVLESDEGTLVMSGDLSLSGQRAVVSASLPNIKADALVLESTYGGKLHANRIAEERRLIDTLKQITEQGGKALIPAFALGRAQEVLQILLAYRDQLDVPVYADGMVRSVCRAYATFADLLPEVTVKAAGEESLFFRSNIHPITTGVQRDDICRSEGPAVIVASSGMLTGGASVAYAKALAGDARNAILLTGYQDEEAPGRFLQRILDQHQAGEEVMLRLDDQSVSLRCALGTYSLSAHADEAELITIAEALGADEIMLVHGDPGARHSLATNLRQRQKHVITPKIGQAIPFDFGARPWALGQVRGGAETRPLEARELWESLKGQAGNFYTAAEIARMWWGDAARAKEVVYTLNADALYFAPDWRQQDLFRVKTAEQITRTRQQRVIMLHYPHLIGQVIVVRDSNNRPRVGVVTAASAEAFEARMYNAKGTHYPADALLWVIGPWRDFPTDEETGRARLSEVVQAAKAIQDNVLPLSRRQTLVSAGQPVQPESLLPAHLPEGVTREIALLALVLALAHDGAAWTPEGLIPQRVLVGEPMEMNQARETALTIFPAAAQLRKVGMEVARKRITLMFDFPEVAARQYADEIDQVIDQTGWEVVLQPQTNQSALGLMVAELLPPGLTVIKGPAFYIDRREVRIEVQGQGDLVALQNAYREKTGFKLVATRAGETAETPAPAAAPPVVAPVSSQKRMEINAAYGVVRAALDPHGLYKTSLKGDQIVLSFISPQVGERHLELIAALAQQTGYAMSIHPHPNQQQILQIAQQLMRQAGWTVRKGPSIHTDRGEIGATLAQPPDANIAEQISQELERQTGYKLVVG